MGKNSDIFNDISTEFTREIVRKAIPILVKWAEDGKFNKTYKDLAIALGQNEKFRPGRMLGGINYVINTLSENTGEEIPTLNCLCKKTRVMLPSDGFNIICENYDQLNNDEKRKLIAGYDYDSHTYSKWHWVLDELGLKPVYDFTEEEKVSVRKSGYGFGGGEGEEHKALKVYILNHPESLGIKDIVKKEDEHDLPSGDRLDVYFEKNNGDVVAIEVKPKSCPEKEINRGIFQCVKYKAVLEAMRKVDYKSYDIDVMLVTDNTFSELNVKLAKKLNVKYNDKFKH